MYLDNARDTDMHNHEDGLEQAESCLVENMPKHVKLPNGFCG